MKILLLLILLPLAIITEAAQEAGCRPQLATPHPSLIDIRFALDELKRTGSLKTQEELVEFLQKFKNLSQQQKTILLPHVLKQISDSKKTRQLKNMDVFISEKTALSTVLGIIHNPYDLYKKTEMTSPTAFLESFLSQRKAAYTVSDIKKTIQLLRKKLADSDEFALIFGSFPNAYAKAQSDIDVVWNRKGPVAISSRDTTDLNRTIKEEEGFLKNLHFTHGTYDSHELQFFSPSSRLNIEVHQNNAYLLLYPTDYEVNPLGVFTISEPIRVLLDEENSE